MSISQMPSHLKWALATLSGCLNGAAFIFYGPLALIANLPLLLALRSAQSFGEAISLGAWVGFLGGIHIFGVLNYGWWIFWAFSFYTASQMILFGAVIYGVRTYFQTRVNWGLSLFYELWTPCAIWTITEWLRTVGPVALPASYVGCIADIEWLNPLLSWANTMGGLGVSALIALVSSALWLCISTGDIELELARINRQDKDDNESSKPSLNPPKQSQSPSSEEEAKTLAEQQQQRLKTSRAFAGLSGLLLVGILYLWGYLMPPNFEGVPLKVAGLQGGFTNEVYQATEADPLLSVDIVETYEALLTEAKSKDVDLIVWAESALRVPVINTPSLRQRLLPQSEEEPWLIGGLAHTDPDGQTYNLAFSAHDQRVIGRYVKVKTVPGVEAKFKPGKEWTPLPTEWGAVGVLICFESIYPHAGRALAQAGARLLLVLSNDAGFGETPISHHMTNRAIVRAVETGRWLLRVGQAGVTTLIDPRGIQHGTLNLFEAGVLYGEAMLRGEVTPFVRFGVSWLWGLLVFLLVPLVYVLTSHLISVDEDKKVSVKIFPSQSFLIDLRNQSTQALKRIQVYVRTIIDSRGKSKDDKESSDDDPYQ